MAINCNQIQAYANNFLPQFQFADTENIYPISIESWIKHCSVGDWNSQTDPHRGSAVVQAPTPLQINGLTAVHGCQEIPSQNHQGPPSFGPPLDPTQPPPAVSSGANKEAFIDFAGWSSLQSSDGFVTGDDTYIRDYFSSYFQKFNPLISISTPPTRTPPTIPTGVTIYCEAAWAGDLRRRTSRTCSRFLKHFLGEVDGRASRCGRS